VEPDASTEQVLTLPLDVNAKISFYQRINGTDQAIRFYDKAQADIKLEKGTTRPAIEESNRLIVARLKQRAGERVEFASITDVLQQSELELIQNAADPLTLASIFTKEEVKVGAKWQPSNAALAKLLMVQHINKSNVQMMLKSANSELATVYIMGSVTADVDDVVTKMDISGIAILDRKTEMVSSLKLGISEIRAPGQIAPGFEGKTKIAMRIDTGSNTPHLSNAELAKHTKGRKIRRQLKWKSETGQFVLKYEPRWRMIAAEPDAAVLRYIDKDELLTQCNIVHLPSRPVDKPLDLEVFKNEVAKIVSADKGASLVSANAVPMSHDNTALRVVVSGEEEGLPVNWFYYHASCQDGRQVTLVFTLAESVAKRVTTIADKLISELQFLPMPEQKASTVAKSKMNEPSQRNR